MALYGLKYLGAAFRAFLEEMLDDIGFRSSIADPDVCMRAANKPISEIYYDYTLCYVDDILCISHDYRQKMGETQNNVKVENNNIEEPDLYLVAIFKNKELNSQRM